MGASSSPAAGPGGVITGPIATRPKEKQVPKTVQVPLPEEGETLYDTEEKLFEDIQANPGEKAFIFIHTVPY